MTILQPRAPRLPAAASPTLGHPTAPAASAPRRSQRVTRNSPRLSPSALLLTLAAAAVTTLILLIPAYLIYRSAGAGDALSTLLSARTLAVLATTVGLAAAVTGAATLLAVALAWLTTATDLPGRRVWSILAALPLILPSYVAAYVYVSLLSPRGHVQQLLAPLGVERLPNVYGWPGAFVVLTLITYPYVYLTVRAAMRRLDPSLVEAARSLGLSPWQAFRRVTLPHLRPSITAGALLVALYVLRDFGAVTMLQVNTFTRIIYNRYLGYRLETAATLALMLILLTVIILYFEQRSRGRTRYGRLSAGAARPVPTTRLGRWRLPALLFTTATALASLGLPVAGLLYWLQRGLSGQSGIYTIALASSDATAAQSNVQALTTLLLPAWNSVSAGFLAALVTVVLALPIAILAVRRPGPLSRLFEQVAYGSFALPGIVVALALVFAGINLLPGFYQTLPMLLAAYAILFIPQAIGAQRASLLQIAPSLEEAARVLGASPLGAFRRVTLPLIRPGLLGGAALVFLTAMKELPATLLLSPLGFTTLASQVWTNIGEAFFARAALPTLLLLLLSSLPLALLTLRDDR
jgi:iron(III) transport system permease protein